LARSLRVLDPHAPDHLQVRIITLKADNKGEGRCVLPLCARSPLWQKAVYPAIIGAGTLLADGIITRPSPLHRLSKGSAVVQGMEHIIVPGNNLVVELVLVIILLLFRFSAFRH